MVLEHHQKNWARKSQQASEVFFDMPSKRLSFVPFLLLGRAIYLDRLYLMFSTMHNKLLY